MVILRATRSSAATIVSTSRDGPVCDVSWTCSGRVHRVENCVFCAVHQCQRRGDAGSDTKDKAPDKAPRTHAAWLCSIDDINPHIMRGED